jgi:hypothetical protein
VTARLWSQRNLVGNARHHFCNYFEDPFFFPMLQLGAKGSQERRPCPSTLRISVIASRKIRILPVEKVANEPLFNRIAHGGFRDQLCIAK